MTDAQSSDVVTMAGDVMLIGVMNATGNVSATVT